MATKPPKPALKPRNIKVMKVWKKIMKNGFDWAGVKKLLHLHISSPSDKNIFHS